MTCGTIVQTRLNGLFTSDDYPITRKRIESLLAGRSAQRETIVLNGIKAEWALANNMDGEPANRALSKNDAQLT